MGTITISLPEKEEHLLRTIAREKHGDKKGALAKTIVEAIRKEESASTQEHIKAYAISLMNSGKKFKRLWKTRDELHER